jgi:iron complex outermembrane recepter protein
VLAASRYPWTLLALISATCGPVRAQAPVGAAAEFPVQTHESVVVTATLRASELADVPVSASIFSGAAIADSGIEQLKDLTSLEPSLGTVNSISESFGQLLQIRGIETSGADIGLESAVGVTIDGVPISRPDLVIGDLQGIDRVEVLRGPQGTLFGKNTTAGVINVLTLSPSFSPAVSTEAVLGNRDERELRFAANGGISRNDLAGRLDALYANEGGYLHDTVTGVRYGGREREQVRGQLLWTPLGDLTVRAIADFAHHDGTTNAPDYRVVGATGPEIALLAGVPLVAHPNAPDLTEIDAASPRFDRSDTGGVSVETNWRSAAGPLTAILAYRASEFARSYDVDNSPADLVRDPHDGERYGTATAEMRLQGRSGIWDHLMGAFFAHEFVESRDSYTFGQAFEIYADAMAGGYIPAITGLPLGTNYPMGDGVRDSFRQKTTDFALFSHNILNITDWLSLTGGLRFSLEDKILNSRLSSDNPGCSGALAKYGPNLGGVPAALKGLICIPNLDPRYDGNYRASRSESNWSGTVATLVRLTEELNAYASFSRGYKPGGFQLDRSGMDPLAPDLMQLEFGAEKSDSYEAGLKASSRDDLFHLDAALFSSAFKNYQFSYFTGLNRQTANVPELDTRGFELETDYQPTRLLGLFASTNYEEAVFGRSGFPAGLQQVQGTTAPTAPRWTLIGGARPQMDFPGFGLTAFGYVDARWQSRTNVGGSAAPSPNFQQAAYALVDARVGLGNRSGSWQIEAWARNLFDTHAWSVLNNTTLQPGSISGYVIHPRSWGINARLTW